jgi:pimeloyl-ACP methyl ester carboxylesterase
LCWRQQLQLADRFALEIVDRAGYGRSQRVSPGEDLNADAPLVAGLLTEPAHLVGHSFGAMAAMLAAALRPGAVLSLTLCEPPAFQLAPGSAQAQQMARDLEEHLHKTGDDAPWLRGFLGIVGRDIVIPDRLPPPLAQGVRAIRAVRRRPWQGELPVGPLAAASFPKLVISGNHSPAFEAVCDALAARLKAQRAHVSGAGHARYRRCISTKPSRHSSAQRRAEQHQLDESALHSPENCESREIIGKTLIPADSFGTRTLRTPPEGDYDDHFAGRSRPNHRSVRLGHNV